MKKFIVAGTVVAIIVGAVLVMQMLIATKPESKKMPTKVSVIGVKSMPVKLEDYSLEVSYPGRVTPREMVTLSAEVAGRLTQTKVTLSAEVAGRLTQTKVPLKEGQRFKKGDVLIEIFDEDVKAEYSSQASNFLRIIATALPDIKVDLPSDYDKWHAFFSEINIDEDLPALPKINSEKEKVYVSTKGILDGYYSLKRNYIVLQKYRTIAPFDGIYTSVLKEVGSVASANSEVARIASTSDLELVVGVPLESAQLLSHKSSVDVKSLSGKIYKGVIDRISAFVDEKTQRVNIYVRFNEPGLDIIDGQVLDLTIPSKKIEGVQNLLREAIIGDTLVYVVNDNKIFARKIEIAASNDTNSFVRGLKEGERVVGESLVTPQDGMTVRVLDMNGKALQQDKTTK